MRRLIFLMVVGVIVMSFGFGSLGTYYCPKCGSTEISETGGPEINKEIKSMDEYGNISMTMDLVHRVFRYTLTCMKCGYSVSVMR